MKQTMIQGILHQRLKNQLQNTARVQFFQYIHLKAKSIVKADLLNGNKVLHMSQFFLQCHQRPFCFDTITEHISKSQCHNGNIFCFFNLCQTVDCFQSIIKEVGIDLRFQCFHLGVHQDHFVFVLGFNVAIVFLQHGLILIVQGSDLICTIHIRRLHSSVLFPRMGHNMAQCRNWFCEISGKKISQHNKQNQKYHQRKKH